MNTIQRLKVVGRRFALVIGSLMIVAMVTHTQAKPAFAEDQPVLDASSENPSAPPSEFSPMTRSERLSRYLVGLTNCSSAIRATAVAGLAQARNTPKEWGGRSEGFGKRVASTYSRHFVQATLQYSISATHHEDNRYFVSRQSGFLRRTQYAIVSVLLARHDNGSRSFSFSSVGSAAGAAFISRTWQPKSSSGPRNGAVSFGVSMGTAAGFNILREFWSDLKRLRKE